MGNYWFYLEQELHHNHICFVRLILPGITNNSIILYLNNFDVLDDLHYLDVLHRKLKTKRKKKSNK